MTSIVFHFKLFTNEKISFYLLLLFREKYINMAELYKNKQLAVKRFPQQLNGVKIDLCFPSWMTKATMGINVTQEGCDSIKPSLAHKV